MIVAALLRGLRLLVADASADPLADKRVQALTLEHLRSPHW